MNQRNRKNRVSPCFARRNSRDIAGLNVSELNAEKTNEKTIVIANWLYSFPVIPGMNATGTNTAASTSVIVTIGVVISAIAARVASSGAQAPVEVLLDVLDHDDRVVDHQADRQDQAAERQRVDREAEGRHHRERGDQRDRDRQHRDDRGAEALEEHEHDDHDQDERLDQRVLDLLDVLVHVVGRVVDDRVVEPFREARLEVVHLLADLRG